MTEAQIENTVERRTDRLDAALMDGRLSQAEYDAEMRALSAWADAQYAARR